MAAQFHADLASMRPVSSLRMLHASETSTRTLPDDIIGMIRPYCYNRDEPVVHVVRDKLCFDLPNMRVKFTAKRLAAVRLPSLRPIGEIFTRDLRAVNAVAYFGNYTFGIFIRRRNEGYILIDQVRIDGDYFRHENSPIRKDHWHFVRRHPCGTVQLQYLGWNENASALLNTCSYFSECIIRYGVRSYPMLATYSADDLQPGMYDITRYVPHYHGDSEDEDKNNYDSDESDY